MKLNIFILLCMFTLFGHSQDEKFNSEDLSITEFIDGALLTPLAIKKPDLAIIIGGSGPTDRDGNQSVIKNNSLKN